MPNERFYAQWEPRVGVEATQLIRKRSWLKVLRLAPFVSVVVLLLTVGRSLYYVVVWPLVFAFAIAYAWYQRSIDRRLADALSRHLGLAITPRNLPPVRNVESFDAVVSDIREGRPGRQKSFFGGFLRFGRP